MNDKKKYTINEIAELSGYSARTVSRVINDKPYVKEETRKKIKKILKETGFETNIFAKNLRKKAMKNIMVIIEKQGDIYPGQWYTNMYQKIINKASQKGYNVFMKQYIPGPNGEEVNTFRLLKSGFVDGVILFNIRKEDKKVKGLKELKIPFVTIGKMVTQDTSYVVTDNYKGAYWATEHLLKNNRKDIVFMVGNPEYTINQDRIEGFKDALQDYKIEFKENMLYTNMRSFTDIYEISQNLIENNNIPSGIFVSGDEKAFGALKALNDYSIQIPETVSVIGFDNIPISRFATPSLSTVEQPVDKIVDKVLKILFNSIKNNGVGKEQVTIPARLVVRDSTGGLQ